MERVMSHQESRKETGPVERCRNHTCEETLLSQDYNRYLQKHRKHEVPSEALFPPCKCR